MKILNRVDVEGDRMVYVVDALPEDTKPNDVIVDDLGARWVYQYKWKDQPAPGKYPKYPDAVAVMMVAARTRT